MEGGGANAAAQAQAPQPSSQVDRRHDDDGDEDIVVEVDPDGRYQRFAEVVGHGRFKAIWKAFDTNLGIDVAWSKIHTDAYKLDPQEVQQLVAEMEKGLRLDHPHIIKCYKCWEDASQQSINLITELFTSGSLRQYRNSHPTLDHKALKRMARQILQGLHYLHSQQPPIFHGDLRCDKIYVNGNKGEIKIGDLGLATLQGKAAGDAGTSSCSNSTSSSGDLCGDVFDFGLCLLELLTLEKQTSKHCPDWAERVQSKVADPLARDFLVKCLQACEKQATAADLLEHPWLLVKKAASPAPEPRNQGGGPSSHFPDDRPAMDSMSEQIATGQLRGEDYRFQIQGKIKGGKMHFRLIMDPAQDESEPTKPEPTLIRTIDFEFDPDTDTVDSIASEIGHEFNLSTTDTEICASVLREFLAREMPDTGNE